MSTKTVETAKDTGMADFKIRLEGIFRRLLFSFTRGVTVKVTETAYSQTEERKRSDHKGGLLGNYLFKDGDPMFVVEIIADTDYLNRHRSLDEPMAPVRYVCDVAWRTLGLAQIAIGSRQNLVGSITHFLPKRRDVYDRLPPPGETLE